MIHQGQGPRQGVQQRRSNQGQVEEVSMASVIVAGKGVEMF